MAETEINYPLDVSKTVRIDRGPAVRKAIATESFLASGKVAEHYRVGAYDAHGKEIVEGKQFHYVDWKADVDDHIFTVYELKGDEDGNERYHIVERCATHEAAHALAMTLGG